MTTRTVIELDGRLPVDRLGGRQGPGRGEGAQRAAEGPAQAARPNAH